MREHLALVMAELDPQAALDLAAVCPACGVEFLAPFDAAEFLRQELMLTGDALFREVHLLASHYHWDEADILALPRRRRRRYLACLGEAMVESGSR